MRLLLDTHTLIWWAIRPARLSRRARSDLAAKNNDLLLSLASVWEMQIKLQLGKLRFDVPLAEILEKQQRLNGLALLPIEAAHIYALNDLPLHHNDPFDRLLIASAIPPRIEPGRHVGYCGYWR